MTPLALRGTRIARLRVHASDADPQPRAERCALALRSLDLEPATMPPQAILCVRTLSDPMPGGLDSGSRHSQLRPIAWESAMREALRGTLGRAARPIHGPAPADAGAVLFADPSELLACAARDACRGPLSSFWWWQHLLPVRSFESVVDAWTSAPEYVPPAFASLMAAGAAMPFVRKLPAASATRLLDAVLRAHALPALADAIGAVWTAPASTVIERKAQARATSLPDLRRRTRKGDSPAHASPWRGIVPNEWDPSVVGVERHALVAMSIVLRRSPSLPRRDTFRRDAATYLRFALTASVDRDPARGGEGGAGISTARAPMDAKAMVRAEPLAPPLRREEPRPAPPPSRAAASSTAPPRRHAARPVVTEPTPVASAAADTTTPHAAPVMQRTIRQLRSMDERNARKGGDARGSPPAASPDTGLAPPVVAPATESALAGAFFILNAAIDLELYSDGVVARDEVDLGVWDFVELVAREFSREEDDDDPLWNLLIDLAGPEPRVGLTPAERKALLARVRGHVAALVDVEDPGRFLIARQGRIVRTPGHIDVHFSLERHPIEIRLARLDRNPGWIPAAGVHVAFYFD